MKFTLKNYCLLLVLALFTTLCHAQEVASEESLIVIEQEYDEALRMAQKADKLVFVDFYTTWCGPCKELDKMVFQNTAYQEMLGEQVVLLKYDAEQDADHHLSKKYYVSSYPTALILDADGKALIRKRGFPGNDGPTLSKGVMDLVGEAVALKKKGQYIPGYSTKIDPTAYPDFYVDFVERTNVRVDSATVNEYLLSGDDIFAEPYFVTLVYFGSEAGEEVANQTLKNQEEYIRRYGTEEVEGLLYYLSLGKINRAIAANDPKAFQEALDFVKTSLDERWQEDILPQAQQKWLKAQQEWGEWFKYYADMKANGEMDNGYLNYIAYTVYLECDEQEILQTCVDWMRAVTTEEPTFDYLDTYAFILHKAGNVAEAKQVAMRAIEVGKAEDRKVTQLEKLVAN